MKGSLWEERRIQKLPIVWYVTLMGFCIQFEIGSLPDFFYYVWKCIDSDTFFTYFTYNIIINISLYVQPFI